MSCICNSFLLVCINGNSNGLKDGTDYIGKHTQIFEIAMTCKSSRKDGIFTLRFTEGSPEKAKPVELILSIVYDPQYTTLSGDSSLRPE